MWGRNPELRRLAAAYVLIAVVCACAAAVALGPRSGAAVLIAAAALAVPVSVAMRARYRAIARMSERVDRVLHGARSLDLDGMEEGELSVLASELGKMVARLNRTAAELERESGALADALADVSHQLKTPLTSAAILCDLMRRRLAESPDGLTRAEADEMARRLRTVSALQERVQWLVGALLRLARIDAGAIRFARVRVDAAELIDAAAAPLEVAFDLAGVALEREVWPGVGFTGDPSWSREALENVLKNCLEHTPVGGRVRVAATEDAVACRISVEDTGPGIAAADLPHIFERFYRGEAEAAGAVDPAGVGIGLALARSLVAAQGGALTACNAADAEGHVAGAHFDFTFFKSNV